MYVVHSYDVHNHLASVTGGQTSVGDALSRAGEQTAPGGRWTIVKTTGPAWAYWAAGDHSGEVSGTRIGAGVMPARMKEAA